MSFSESFNGGMTVIFSILAIVTSFIFPAEVCVALLFLAISSAVYCVGLMIGNRDGNADDALSFFWEFIIVIILVFAVIYWRYGLMYQGQFTQISILDSLYFSVTTFTTLGYGDFSPTPRIRHITSVQALLGYISLGIWMGLISKLIGNLDEMRRDITKKNADLLTTLKKQPSDQEYPD
jgi:hypothetical protein